MLCQAGNGRGRLAELARSSRGRDLDQVEAGCQGIGLGEVVENRQLGEEGEAMAKRRSLMVFRLVPNSRSREQKQQSSSGDQGPRET